jgi:hypothetical protein
MSIEVRCRIKDETGEWEETIDVESIDTAEQDVNKLLKWFNEGLRPGETPRKLVAVLAEKKIENKTTQDKIKDFHLLVRDLRHEVSNAYGNRWLKSKFHLLMRAYDKLLETGKSKMLNKYVKECINNVSDIPEKCRYLENVDIVALFASKCKEE